jgi:hypothetical protein
MLTDRLILVESMEMQNMNILDDWTDSVTEDGKALSQEERVMVEYFAGTLFPQAQLLDMTQEKRNCIRYKFWLALFNMPYFSNTQARKALSQLYCNIDDVLLFLLGILRGKRDGRLVTFHNKEDLFDITRGTTRSSAVSALSFIGWAASSASSTSWPHQSECMHLAIGRCKHCTVEERVI